ncbi:MAG: hypothetical protein Q9171_004559 [Xanthocarpia ochracea]
MGDPADLKQRKIPDWQHEETPRSPEHLEGGSKTTEAPEPVEPPPPRSVILEQASKFLKDIEIKDAPMEKKIAFLRSKGLTEEEVYRLLEIPYDKAKLEVQRGAGSEQASLHTSPPTTHDSEAASSQPSPQPPENTPPIITYPEFLLHSQKLPPLITVSRLINALYLFSGTAAAIYGTSKYLVEPMTESLTSARHDLFSTAQTNLNDMTEKLERNVSKIPSSVSKGNVDDEEDTSSDEDTARLFNRTIGTQTSPPPSTTSASSDFSTAPATTIASLQRSALDSLQASLSSLVPSENTKSTSENVGDQIVDLKRYLNSLKYPSLHTRAMAESKDDAVNKFKAEIRGMKGVLLNARNFPSGTAVGKSFRGRVGE